MGKYDIGRKYDESCKLTISSLCEELMDECEDLTGEVPKGETTYRSKFKNADQSGLIDKLKNILHFDMETIAEQNEIEKFDMLKILKLLYYIEKEGNPKYKWQYEKNVKVQITSILAKPRLENIPTDYSPKSVYGEVFSDMYSQIKSEVPDADEREKRLERIDVYWEYTVEKIFDYVISDAALLDMEKAAQELDRIIYFIDNKILVNIEGFEPSELPDNEGNMKTFFNILACHRLMCNEADRFNINYQVCICDPPSKEYIANYRKYEGMFAKKELIPIIKQELEGRCKNLDAERALYFITYGEEIGDKEIKNYKYALGKVELAVKWLKKYRSGDFSEGIACGTLASIVQEICFAKENKESIRNDYYGYKKSSTSFMAALKKPNEADAVAVQAWVRKFENRTAVNYGAMELIKKKREVENRIFKIKEFIYSYHNLDDLELVNEFLCYFISRSVLVSADAWTKKSNEFFDKVGSRLRRDIENLTFDLQHGGISSMFREFVLNNDGIEDIIAAELATQINESYNNTLRSVEFWEFEICCSERYYFDYIINFKIDKENDIIIINSFKRRLRHDKVERLKKLGLKKFVTI